MRGASAIHGVLEDVPTADLKAFVVWEPVLRTDDAPPAGDVRRRVSDERVAQFWDEDRLLSDAILAAAMGDPRGVLGESECDGEGVVWDWVAVYPPGVRWEGAYPAGAFTGAPVVAVVAGFRDALAGALEAGR